MNEHATVEDWSVESLPEVNGHDQQDMPQPPKTKTLGELARRSEDDPSELLRTGYLCRRGGLLVVGPTGIGKSVFSIQGQILFALGRDLFGIRPARPLKSLVVQAEDDEGDMAEMRDGVIAGMRLTPEEIQTACQNVIVANEDSRTGRILVDWTLEPLLRQHQPDLIWINPALAYIGGDSSSQRDVGTFLRNFLNPLLHKFNCGGILIHHTNKPPINKREKSGYPAGDYAYLGSGSAEWANWARAVLAIRPVGPHTIFELRAGKRGSRIGWTDDTGEKSFSKLIGHSKEPGKIYWRDASADKVPAVGKGRPKSSVDDELFELLPSVGLLTVQWRKSAKKRLDISDSKFYREVRDLKDAGRIIKSKVSGTWLPMKTQ